jgi:hypothetical protein
MSINDPWGAPQGGPGWTGPSQNSQVPSQAAWPSSTVWSNQQQQPPVRGFGMRMLSSFFLSNLYSSVDSQFEIKQI